MLSLFYDLQSISSPAAMNTNHRHTLNASVFKSPPAAECIRMLWGNKHTFPLKHDLQGTLALARPLRRLQLACYSEICCCPLNNYLHHWSILLGVANEDLAESLHYCPCRQFMKFHPFLPSHCTDLCYANLPVGITIVKCHWGEQFNPPTMQE